MNRPKSTNDSEADAPSGNDDARFRAVWNMAVDAMITIDERGVIESANPATERIFGYREEELIGRNISMLMPEPEASAHDGYLLEYLKTGVAAIIGIGREVTAVRKNGEEFPADLAVSELRVDGRRLFTGMLRDITDRKQAEEELRRQEQQFRFMVEFLPAGAVYVDRSSDTIFFNRAAEAVTGYRSEELPTLDEWFERLYLTSAAEIRRLYLEDHATGFRPDGVVPITRKDGSRRHVEFAGYRYGHHEVWMLNDVTDRYLAKEALRAERDFAESLVETAHAIVLVLDTNGRIVRFNPFLEELIGIRLDDVRGHDWFDTFMPERDRSRSREPFLQAIAGEPVRGHINSIETTDGTELEISWWTKALVDADGNVSGLLSIGHDITDLREAQQKLVQSERLAAIGQMMAGLAHESRNALQRAQACLDMLELDIGEDSGSDLLKLTKRGRDALDELNRLYEEVRGYAAPIRLEREWVDLQKLWQGVWNHLIDLHRDRTIQLVESLDGVAPRCRIDRHRIEQVFRNILENAIAAGSEVDEVTVTCADTIIGDCEGVRISIRDNGPGFDNVQKRRIFEPFFTTKSKGTGLGMAIANRFVEAHGGTIVVGDSNRRGGEIIVCLPKAPP